MRSWSARSLDGEVLDVRLDTSTIQAVRTPRYQQIADELRSRIQDGAYSSDSGGRYSAGRLLPSEANLSDEFDVSRVTVRRALDSI